MTITSVESGTPLQNQSSADFSELLKAAQLSEDYTDSNGEIAFQKIADALAENKRLKQDQRVAPDAYDFALTDPNIKHPDGAQFAPGKDDPDFLNEITTIAREANLDQATVSKLTNAYARHGLKKIVAQKAANEKAATAQKAEMDKLGPNGKDRIDAVKRYVGANYGGQEASDQLFAGGAKGIEVLENMISDLNAGGRSSTHRGGEAGKPKYSDLVGKKGGARELLRAGRS